MDASEWSCKDFSLTSTRSPKTMCSSWGNSVARSSCQAASKKNAKNHFICWKNPFRTIHKHPFPLSVPNCIIQIQKNTEVMNIYSQLSIKSNPLKAVLGTENTHFLTHLPDQLAVIFVFCSILVLVSFIIPLDSVTIMI